MLGDMRFAIRMLLKQPGFSLIAVLTLALGIGATSAVFSLIQGVLLTPPPYKKPQQLVLVPTARTDGQTQESPRGWPAQQWMEWQKEAKSIEGIAAYGWTFNFLIRNEGSQSVEGMEVTKDYLQVMGLQPVLGRGFEESDIGTGPVKVILLGYDFWKRTFNGDPQIIGKTVRISRWEVPPTVIGVMPPGIRFLPSPGAAKEPNYNVNAPVDFWIPVGPDPKYLKDPYWNIVARLRDGAGLQQAIPRLDGVTAGWAVLAWGLGAAVLAAFFAGIFPALRAFRLDPMEVLKNAGPKGTAGLGERRLLRGVTMAQTALTLALLVGAGLLIRTMINIAKVPSGYNTGHILTMSVTEVRSYSEWANFHRHALERVSAIPGVQYAAFAWGVPLTGNNWPATLEIEGQPPAIKESDKTAMPLRAVRPDYFQLMGLAMLEGQQFRSTDDRKAPNVAIVNQTF